MPATRITPHRIKREEQKAKELTEVKQENRLLKRKVARLEKLLAKHERAVEEGPIEPEEEGTALETKSDEKCAKCNGNDLAQLAANGKIYVVCKNKICLNRWVK